jgi:hypothetical protein
MPLALSDNQLRIITAAAANMPAERRSAFLEAVAAELRDRPRFTKTDFAAAVRKALAAIRAPAA